jgi:phosphoribosylformylglycinamidine synthase
MGFLHDGLPRPVREASLPAVPRTEPRLRAKRAYDDDLVALLAMPQIGSKEWVIRQYDHEVQAGAVVRPLVGPGAGPSDAAVLAPKLGSKRGIVLSGGIQPGYGDVDPYAMALAVVDEAIRNAVCVGADPRRIALLDNFTWGNCRRPETLGSLVRAAEGCRDAALLFRAPFVSGKDSLNNEFRTEEGTVISVPPTLLISAIGVIPDVRETVTMDLKAEGDLLYVVGETHDELGGSHWYRLKGHLGARVPVVRRTAPATMRAVAKLVRHGLVRAAHDPSEGGLAVAAAEMAIASSFGLAMDLDAVPATTDDPARRLFSESASRFLLEVAPGDAGAVEERLAKAGIPHARAGRVTKAPRLEIRTGRVKAARAVVSAPVERLRDAWRHALPVHGEAP